MRRYVLTPDAKDDLTDLVSYVRKRSPQGARIVAARLRREMERIASAPGIGHVRADLADEELRAWAVYSYVIIYRSHERGVQIIRILHGARDVGAVIAPRP